MQLQHRNKLINVHNANNWGSYSKKQQYAKSVIKSYLQKQDIVDHVALNYNYTNRQKNVNNALTLNQKNKRISHRPIKSKKYA